MKNKVTLTKILGEFLVYFIVIGIVFGFAIAGVILTIVYLVTR